ncbi:MAG: hypothetical protein RIN53_04810 [Gammaproteobacteria bacterium]
MLFKRELIEAVGVIAVVLSLIFVGFELRFSSTVAQTETYGAGNEINANFHSVIVENADVWQRGCLGEQLTDEERSIFAHIFFMYQNKSFVFYARSQTGLLDRDSDGIAMDSAIQRYRYPGINEMWIQRVSATSPNYEYRATGGWWGAVESAYQQLLLSDYPKEADPALCGI